MHNNWQAKKQLKTIFVQCTIDKIALINIVYFRGNLRLFRPLCYSLMKSRLYDSVLSEITEIIFSCPWLLVLSVYLRGDLRIITFSTLTIHESRGFGFLFWIFSRQGPQTGASHRRAVVCNQLAQSCYLRVQWLGIEPRPRGHWVRRANHWTAKPHH